MRRFLAVLAAATALIAVVATAAVGSDGPSSQATAKNVKLKITPKKPFVDDDVRVSFKVPKRLPAGWEYSGLLTVRSNDVGCAEFVIRSTTRRPKRGQRLGFRFSSYDDILDPSAEWCQGKATVSIITGPIQDADGDGEDDDPSDDDEGDLIGIESFRFRAQP